MLEMDDVMEDEGDGGRRWIVRGNPTIQIDCIVHNIIVIGTMLYLSRY